MATFLRTLLLLTLIVAGVASAIFVADPNSPMQLTSLANWGSLASGDGADAAASNEPTTDRSEAGRSEKRFTDPTGARPSSRPDDSQSDSRPRDPAGKYLVDRWPDNQDAISGSLPVGRPRLATPKPELGTQIGQLGSLIEQLQNSLNQPPTTIEDVLQGNQRLGQPDDSDSPAAEGQRSEESLPPPEERLQIRNEGDGRTSISMYGADIRQVLDMFSVQGELNVLTGPSVTGPVFGTLNNVQLDQALDAVVRLAGFQASRMGDFILVGTPEELLEMQRLSQRVVTRVYRPNYVSAEELQLLITSILSPAGTAAVTSSTTVSPRSEQGIAGGGDSAGGDSFAGNEVVLVRDLESVIAQIDQIYDQLDTRPMQVSIEATILSVRLDDRNQFGVDFELLQNRANVRLVGNSPLANLAALSVNDGGLKFGFLDSSISSFVTALETIGDANVVASPRLMCVNKQQAEILIGSELGYVSTTVTETAATQSVEFLEVGTQLRFRPFISRDGTVRLEIHPELSTGNVRIEGGFTLPDKEVTQVTTNIICPDNKTVIIGGLIREDLSLTTSQLPILGNIPIVGALFRSEVETKDRRELIVLLTPRIVHLPDAHAEATELGHAFAERHGIREDKMSVIGRQFHARRFVRLGRAAWNAGDMPTARRYANLSLQFNPQLFEALQLRREVNGTGLAPESIDMHLRTGLSPFQEEIDYSRNGVPWQTTTPQRLPRVFVEPFEEPGAKLEISSPPTIQRFVPNQD
jgi:type IV pilus assembly protein PilQ